MCRVSIIIPIYNTGALLRRCVQSVIGQTLEDIEIILVDDGSTDESGKICDEFADKDSRIRVIHKSNEGVSIARNTGINMARGEYIGFIDGDDWMDSNMCSETYNMAVSGNYDLVMFDTYVINSLKKLKKMPIDTIELLKSSCELSKKSFYPMLLRYMAGTVWRCIYKREFIYRYNILFPASLPLSEDRIFNIIAMGCCEKMFYYKKPLYYYSNYGTSAVRSYRPDYFDISLKTNKIMREVLNRYWNNEYVKTYDKINSIDGALYHIRGMRNEKNATIKEKISLIKILLNNEELQRILDEKGKLNMLEKLMKNNHPLCIYLLEGYAINTLSRIKQKIKDIIIY